MERREAASPMAAFLISRTRRTGRFFCSLTPEHLRRGRRYRWAIGVCDVTGGL
jgi:hypothetical protein